MQVIVYPRIVVTNEQPKGANPGVIINWYDLVKYNGTLSMAEYEKVVLTHSAN